MEQQLVSICIPCYNHEKYLDDCLKSILKQTYKKIELIIIDDKSSDRSVQIIIVTSTRSSVCCANLILGFSVNFVHKKHLAERYQ